MPTIELADRLESTRTWVPVSTLDEIELNLDKTETHRTLAAETKAGHGRSPRAAGNPDRRSGDGTGLCVTADHLPTKPAQLQGNTTSNQTTMLRLADNELTPASSAISKETVTFTVQGLDYYTAPRKIVVVDPPVLELSMRR